MVSCSCAATPMFDLGRNATTQVRLGFSAEITTMIKAGDIDAHMAVSRYPGTLFLFLSGHTKQDYL